MAFQEVEYSLIGARLLEEAAAEKSAAVAVAAGAQAIDLNQHQVAAPSATSM